jgi:hypothetical protein
MNPADLSLQNQLGVSIPRMVAIADPRAIELSALTPCLHTRMGDRIMFNVPEVMRQQDNLFCSPGMY